MGATGAFGADVVRVTPDQAATVWRKKPDPELVERTYSKLRALQISVTLELAIAIGRTIVETLYQGDIRAWRRHGKHETSLRQLAFRFRSETHGMSTAALHRGIAAYELDRRLGLSARKHLTATHVRAIAAAPRSEQERLLRCVECEGWSTRTLELEIARRTSDDVFRRVGRPRLSRVVKAARLMSAALDELDACADASMSDEDRRLLSQTMAVWREQLAGLQQKIDAGGMWRDGSISITKTVS
jgi:hypothetical protein